MLSNLTAEHAPALIKHLLDGRPTNDRMWAHWRGRYGLSEADQAQVWASVAASREDPAVETRQTEKGGKEVGLRFRTFEGEVREVRGTMGESLLEVGKQEGLPALEGVCGGNLGGWMALTDVLCSCPSLLPSSCEWTSWLTISECATCHLYLPADTPVPPPSEEELDMLGYALGYRDGESRLGCQIKVTTELAEWSRGGGVIGLPRF